MRCIGKSWSTAKAGRTYYHPAFTFLKKTKKKTTGWIIKKRPKWCSIWKDTSNKRIVWSARRIPICQKKSKRSQHICYTSYAIICCCMSDSICAFRHCILLHVRWQSCLPTLYFVACPIAFLDFNIVFYCIFGGMSAFYHCISLYVPWDFCFLTMYFIVCSMALVIFSVAFVSSNIVFSFISCGSLTHFCFLRLYFIAFPMFFQLCFALSNIIFHCISFVFPALLCNSRGFPTFAWPH